ncbi:hypothetical protein LIP73_12575 [Dorea longicatena]|nr:hypothetical protein [Dorea formicigenerans]MCB5537127.1 hypothetical protein [bacterium MSK17_88]MCB5547636.1 hypothetical protein [Dorea longicatena]MCB7081768.1 hypothetical protein [bacterium 210928-DFI.3.100]MCB6955480.1 hypothetical protein [Dorea longicatena]
MQSLWQSRRRETKHILHLPEVLRFLIRSGIHGAKR